MSVKDPIIELPLKALIDKLESAGFYIGVDTRLQMLTILNKFGDKNRKQPYQLKTYLAPMVAKSKQEQELFHQIFDRYYREACEPYPRPKAPPTFWDRIKTYSSIFWWVIPSLLAILLTILIFLSNRTPTPIPSFDLPDTVALGETVDFAGTYLNGTDADQASYEFQWSIDQKPLDKPLVFTHKFLEEGTRIITLRARYSENNLLLSKFRYVKLDSIFSKALSVICPYKPEATIDYEPLSPVVNKPITFTVDKKVRNPSQAILTWEVGGQEFFVDSFQHTITQAGIYSVKLLLKDVGAEEPCDITEINESFSVSAIARKELNRKILESDQSRVTFHFEKDHFARIVILGVLVVVCLYLFERFQYLRKKKSSSRSSLLDFMEQPRDNPPYLLPIPIHSTGIKTEDDIYELAQGLQQRVASDISRIDLPATVKATTREVGLLELIYRSYTRSPEYLVLIDGSTDSNHQSKLFEYLVQTLVKENVLMDIFYFDVTPRLCYNQQTPQGLDLKELQQKYSDHRLLIFGEGHQLLHAHYPMLREWVEPELTGWEYRMIFTPTPYKMWGSQEQELQQFFTVLPVDLKSELLSFQAFQNVEKKQLVRQLDKLDLQESYINPNSLIEVRQYLGSDTFLFYWLASLAIYPKLNWNLTIAIGKGISEQCSSLFGTTGASFDSSITYSSILKLSRIKWLQEGHIPEEIRLQLLDALPPQVEKAARGALLDTLEEIQLPADAMANRELQIHMTTNRYLQNPYDNALAEEMYLLWKNGLIADPQLKKHISRNRKRLLGKAAPLLFERLKQFRPIVSMVLAILLGAWVLIIVKSKNNPEKLESSIFKTLVENRVDSAIYYNNLGVQTTDDNLAIGYFDKALNHRNDYSLARTNKEYVLFNIAVGEYDHANYNRAIQQLRSLKDTTSIRMEVWYAMGLSFIYVQDYVEEKAKRDSVMKYNNLILAQDSGFYDKSDLPVLADLIDGKPPKTDEIVKPEPTPGPIPFTITGRVFDDSQQPIQGANLLLNNLNIPVGISGTLGEFSFSLDRDAKKANPIQIIVSKEGYETDTVYEVISGEDIYSQIILTESLRQEVTIPNFARLPYPDNGPAISANQIQGQVRWLSENPDYGMELIGHAFDSASAQGNLILAFNRAEALRSMMVAQGIPEQRIKVLSLGNTQPTRALDPDRMEFRILSPQELADYIDQKLDILRPEQSQLNTTEFPVLEAAEEYLKRVEEFQQFVQSSEYSPDEIEAYNAALGQVNKAYERLTNVRAENQSVQQKSNLFEDIYEDLEDLHSGRFSKLDEFSLKDSNRYRDFMQKQGARTSGRIAKDLDPIRQKILRIQQVRLEQGK